jgi:hypothetical protein
MTKTFLIGFCTVFLLTLATCQFGFSQLTCGAREHNLSVQQVAVGSCSASVEDIWVPNLR